MKSSVAFDGLFNLGIRWSATAFFSFGFVQTFYFLFFFFQLSCQNVNKSVNLDVHIAWSLKMCIFMCNMRPVLNFEINIMLIYLNLNDLYRLIMRDRAAQDNVKFRPHWLLILEVRPRIFLHISKFRIFLFLLPFPPLSVFFFLVFFFCHFFLFSFKILPFYDFVSQLLGFSFSLP